MRRRHANQNQKLEFLRSLGKSSKFLLYRFLYTRYVNCYISKQ